MPRNVRNFWIEASVDGRRSDINTGPRKSDGGFSCTIYVREEGSISDKYLRIGGAHYNGKNILSVELVENGGITKELQLEVNRDEAPKVKAPKVKTPKVKTPQTPEGYVKVELDHAEVELCQSWYSGQDDPLYGLQCTGLIREDALESAIRNLLRIKLIQGSTEDEVDIANGLVYKLRRLLEEEKSECLQRQDAFWRIIDPEKGN